MKRTGNFVPCSFDNKDLVLPEFWELFDNHHTYVSYCLGKDSYEAMFYIKTIGRDKPYKARILKHDSNILDVTAIEDNGTIWLEDAKEIQEIFMQDNSYKDNDIYVTCATLQEHDGRIVKLTFRYFHTDINFF